MKYDEHHVIDKKQLMALMSSNMSSTYKAVKQRMKQGLQVVTMAMIKAAQYLALFVNTCVKQLTIWQSAF